MNELDEQDLRVLKLYAHGRGLRYIADELQIRLEAAHYHVRRLHEHFGTKNMSELLPIAERHLADSSDTTRSS